MKSEEVAARLDCNPSTARNWAAKNGVGRKMVMGIYAFDWTSADVERFAQRPKAGRPRKK